MGSRRVVAVAAAIYGAIMLARPDDWRTSLFLVPFSLAPRWWWGLGFLTAGLLKALLGRPWTAFYLGSVIGAWVACIIWSVLRGYIDSGAPPSSPAGWVWPTTALVILFLPECGPHERQR